MWVADMDFKAPQEVIDAMRVRLEHGIFGYVSADEILRFAQACSGWLKRRHDVEANPGSMLYSSGVLCGLNAAIQEFTEPGDGIMILTPGYYPFPNGILSNERVVEASGLIDQDGHYEINFAEVEQLAQKEHTKMMILSNPHNPGGRVWTREELEHLMKICVANDVLMFSDEIHSDLILYGNRHTPISSLGEWVESHIVVAYSPSKTFNLSGLSAALIYVPDAQLRNRLDMRLNKINKLPHVNIFGSVAGRTAYENCDYFVDELLTYLEGNIDLFTEEIERAIPGAKVMKPEGTYLLWVDFNGTGLDEQEIYRTVVETGKVAVDLGMWFGTGGNGFCRFNMACPRSLVEQAVHQVAAAFSKR